MATEVEITREEFQRLWGYVPPGESVGVKLFDVTGGTIVAEYKFVGKTQDEIQELEKSLGRGKDAE